MTMGPDNLGGGPATTQDRFAGHLGYRGVRRDGGPPGEASNAEHDLAPSRNGAAPVHEPSVPLERPVDRAGAGLIDRSGGSVGERSTRPLNRAPTLPSLDMDGLAEPTFPARSWMEPVDGALADHPLLRGLLLELPPKGSMPPPGWLDRWFEAARSILELLYIQDTPPRSH